MLQRAYELQDRLVKIRRSIHRHPELGFREEHTAAVVADTLRSLGLAPRTGIARTGVVASLGSEQGPVVGLRADMDALPVQERTGLPFASEVPGVMHACGHDAHTTMLLGAAMLLVQEKALSGEIRLIFQPSEETTDEEGKSGGQRMWEAGITQGLKALLALHVTPYLPAGHVSIGRGPVFAGDDTFQITISGPGGHAASPHATTDTVLLTAQLITSLYHITSRRLDPMDSAVITVGAVHGGSAPNVIPADVQLLGTIRYFESEVRQRIHDEMERALEQVRLWGGTYSLDLQPGGAPTYNDPTVAEVVATVAASLLGEDCVHEEEASLGSEDFGTLAGDVPAAMAMIGAGGEGYKDFHSAGFMVDEAALPIGAALLAEAALRFLRES